LGNAISFTYDPVSNLSMITDPLGNASTRTYDLVSRLLTQTDPRGKVTTLAYDALNRLTQIMDPLGQVTRFTYDGNGNLLTVTDALTHTITHEYDAMDRLSRRMDALGAAETLAYDSTGNLVNTSDRKGQTTTFTYDALNRRMRATYADGSIATFAYDAAGRLVLSDDTTDPHRPITLAYDPLDRLVAETTDMGTVAYEYDILGRRTQMTVNDLNPVTYTYDSASRLRNITQAPLNPVTIDYDAVGRRTKLTLPNAVSTEYQYDAASRLTALIYRNATGLLGDLTYQYDAAGSRTGVGGSFARTLLPDPVTAATYDPANRQLTFGDKTLNYDANGNLTSVTDSSGTTSFTWDVRNRLTALTGPGLTAAFAYDSAGRRAQKAVNGLQSEFQYDISNVSAEVRAGSPVRYLRGLSVDEVFSATDESGIRFATTDTLGSINHLVDPSGAIQATYTYGPFGETQRSGPDGANPFQFTGRENDGSGLYYYRLRYYHPGLRRFISEDPLRPLTGADLNLYTYVLNSPLNAVDPFGLYEEDVHRDLTFCLARTAGYSSSASRRIAASNQETDDNPETSPFAGREARRDWHFTTEARRTDLWQRALDGNLDQLGQYLHALQDSYSHERYPPWRGHLFQGHRPDKTYNDPERANRMARDTYNHLRQYLQVTTGQSVPDHWDQIREHVDRFNRARTAHEKRKTLCR
jgi:RHS repeat-associated protein